LGRWLLGATLLFLGGFAFGPSQARADCGDYVMMGRPSGGAKSPNHIVPSDSASLPKAPTDRPLPCSGPGCNRAPAAPPAAPATRVSGAATQWPCHFSLASPTLDARSFLQLDLLSLKPDRLASIIFHPPRRSFQHI
jgi:hypothetical protein